MPPAPTTPLRTSIELVGSGNAPRKRARVNYGGGSNRLIRSATQNNFRKRIPLLDADFHRNVNSYGRRTLLTLGRYIYFAFSPIRQAVKEQSEFAASTFLPEYRGADALWKQEAEDLLWEHDRWADVAGPPYTMRTYRKSLVRAALTDGDIGTIYVRDKATGLPYLQVIPSHRIGSDSASDVVEGGPFDGASIIDGVIVDSGLRPIAYRVYTGGDGQADFVDISARSMALHFIPHFPGQLRGVSEIGLAAWDCQDLEESNRFELLAQKAGAGRVFVEYNEEGEPLPGGDFIGSPASGSTTTKTPSGLFTETIDQGINTYFKANSGSSLEPVRFDRPSSNQQDFAKARLREVLGAMGTSLDFTLDPTGIGGHASRVLLEKLNRNLASLREEMVEPAVRRFDAFRIAVFMDTGDLRTVEDWHRIEYQGPPEWTGDRKHDSDVDAQEVRMGFKTRTSVASKRNGEALADVRKIRLAEAKEHLTQAKELSEEFDIPMDTAMRLLQDDGNGGSQPATKEDVQKASEKKEEGEE